VVPDDDVARYGDTHFGTIVGHSISQYVRQDRSIDRVCNERDRRSLNVRRFATDGEWEM